MFGGNQTKGAKKAQSYDYFRKGTLLCSRSWSFAYVQRGHWDMLHADASQHSRQTMTAWALAELRSYAFKGFAHKEQDPEKY
jgi:hypothetical protein